MKSKVLPLLLCSSLFSAAQDSALQIKDYKYRTPGFRALSVNLGLSGSYNGNKTGGSEQTDRAFSLGPGGASYYRIVSTDRRLHESGAYLTSLLNLSNRAQNSQKSKYSHTYNLASYYRNDRFYRQGNWFTEVGTDLKAGYRRSRQNDTAINFKNASLELENTFVIGIGKGRLERVQDAQMALYILNDLQRQGLLSAAVTKENAYQFAQLITDINNRRVFDFRRRRIYELTRLDSFLRSSGLAPNPDVRHFVTVNDNWAFAFNPYRLSGSNFYVRLRPGIGYDRDRYNDFKPAGLSNRYSSFFYTVSPEVGYEKYVPVSLRWQRNFGAQLSYKGIQRNDKRTFTSPAGTTVYDGDYYDWSAVFNGFYGIGYFPNNRTILNATFNAEAAYNQDRSFSVSPTLRFETLYFLGYRTYLSANAFAAYNSQNRRPFIANVRQFTSSLSVGLSHFLF